MWEKISCRVFVYYSVNMSRKKQFEVIRDVIKSWTHKIQTSPLSPEDKIYAYKSILEKKLLYVLPTCSLTYKQCLEMDKCLAPHSSMSIRSRETATEMFYILVENTAAWTYFPFIIYKAYLNASSFFFIIEMTILQGV